MRLRSNRDDFAVKLSARQDIHDDIIECYFKTCL